MNSKLVKLADKAWAKGQYSLAAATAHLLVDVSDLNRQINLVGALHEVAYLQNSLSPYWKEFRGNEHAWVERCLSRLTSNDHDYWALAALLGCKGRVIIETSLGMGFKSAALRFYNQYDQPDVHVNTLYLSTTGKVLHPVLEIGYDVKDNTAVDVGRARALLLENDHWSLGEFVGDGWLSLFMRAKLPHGTWRTPSIKFSCEIRCIEARLKG